MFNAEVRKYITEEVLSASRSPDAARRGQQATGEAAITAETPSAPPYSPIVLAGSVRLFELLLVFLAGIVAYLSCVVPFGGFNWMYVVASGCIAVVTMFAFQFADIYQVQAFRGHERQYFRLMSAWSLVFLVLIGGNLFARITVSTLSPSRNVFAGNL